MPNSSDAIGETASFSRARELPAGAILAGGRSRRMGQDKAALKAGEHTLLDLVIERVSRQLFDLTIVGGQEVWAQGRGVNYSADAVSGGRGPLAGLVAAMDFAAQSGSQSPFVFVTAIDMPFLPFDLVAKLVDESRDDLPVIPRYEDRLQPLAALWPTSLRDEIASGLQDNSARSMKDIYQASGHTQVAFETEVVDPFFNVNTPEDLEKVRRILNTRG